MADSLSDPFNQGFHSMCRLCWDKCTVYFSIFDNQAAEMLEALTSIKVNCNDNSSKILCPRCLIELRNAYQTQQKLIKVERLLLEKLSKKIQKVHQTEKSVEEIIISDVDYDKRKQNLEVSSVNVVDVGGNLNLDVIDVEYKCDRYPEKLSSTPDYVNCLDSLQTKLCAYCGKQILIEKLKEHRKQHLAGFYEVSEKANNISSTPLPAKSSKRYLKEYKLFCDWRESNHIVGVNEKVMLTYFEEQYKNAKSSCLWSYYAMIRSCLVIHEKVDIKRFGELRQYLKRKTAGWKPKKSKALTQFDIIKFLREADDDRYLLLKVILILGTFGGCRREELVNVTTDDVKDCGNFIKVRISKTTTGVCRSFVITEEEEGCHACMIIRKYMSLRPDGLHNKRFLIGYRNKKCVSQVVGVNSVGNAPRKIAKYLGLPNAEQYTGHCFRRSSASLLVEGGGNLGILINHGGWKTSRSARK